MSDSIVTPADTIIDQITESLEAIQIKTPVVETDASDAVTSIDKYFSDNYGTPGTVAKSVKSNSVSSDKDLKVDVKHKRRFNNKKLNKKKRIVSNESKASIISSQSINDTDQIENINPLVNLETDEIVSPVKEHKAPKPKTKKKYYKRPILPYNGRIIDGVVFATDKYSLIIPRQIPKCFHKNNNSFVPLSNNIIPITYETPLNVRNTHSYKTNHPKNYILSTGYMSKPRYFKSFNNYMSPNPYSEHFNGHNPFPKTNKRLNDTINNKKVTEKFDIETQMTTAIVDENVNESSASVNTIVASN